MIYPKEYAKIIEDMFEVIFFVDIETSGLDSMRSEILTSSVSVCDYKTLERIDSVDLKFKPECLAFWNEDSEKIHGIKVQQAMQFPDKRQATREMASFFKKYKKKGTQPLVSHSLNFKGGYFDQNFLMFHFMNYDWHFDFRRICGISESTIDYAKAVIKMPSYKLNKLCEHYGIDLNHHDAESDRIACESLYRIFRSA